MRGSENKRETGRHYEHMAASFLEQQGYQILERNYQNRHEEIDIIARDGRYLVFVEVKYRKNDKKGYPEEAVGYYKQQHIRSAARYYMYSHRYGEETPCRFDIVSILGEEIRLIQNAF